MSKLKVPNNKLKEASQFAFMEATHWLEIAEEISDKHSSQKYICYLFSSELYIKSLLMYNGINVTKDLDFKKGHNLSYLMDKLTDEDKELIKRNTPIDKIIFNPITDEKIIFNSFKDELKQIEEDFLIIRYEYEKFMNGKPLYLLIDFAKSLSYNLYKYANTIIFKK